MNKKVIFSLIASLGVLGGNFVNAMSTELKNKNGSSGKQEFVYSEEVFMQTMNLALRDMVANFSMFPQPDGDFRFVYSANIFKPSKDSIYNKTNLFSENDRKPVAGSIDRQVDLTCVVKNGNTLGGFRSLIDQGISILNKNDKIYLPTSNMVIYMPEEAKELMNKWKNEGVYDSKINGAIELYLDRIYETVELFYRGATAGLNDIVSNLSIDSSEKGKVTFKYIANIGKRENPEEVFEYKCNVDSLENDVKNMLHSMLDKAVSILMNGNDIRLNSSNRVVYMIDEGRDLINSWKDSGIYDNQIDGIIKPFIDTIVNKAKDALKK